MRITARRRKMVWRVDVGFIGLQLQNEPAWEAQADGRQRLRRWRGKKGMKRRTTIRTLYVGDVLAVGSAEWTSAIGSRCRKLEGAQAKPYIMGFNRAPPSGWTASSLRIT